MVKSFFLWLILYFNSKAQRNVNKSTILPHNHRTLTLTLFLLAFVAIIFVIFYYDLIFLHKNAIPITNPHPITTAFVKEVSVNDSTSKNDNDIHTQQSSPVLLPPQSIKTHVVKTTILPHQQPSKNNNSGSNQQVSLPISNNNNNNNYYHHHYTHTLTNLTQNVNPSPISSHPQPQPPSSVKYVSNKNSTMTMTITPRSLPIVNNSNTNDIQNSNPTNNHLAIVVHHHDVISSNMTTASNSRTVHKTIISKAPVTNPDPIEIDYAFPRINPQTQQQQREQQLNSMINSNSDPVQIKIIITANAGPNQKVKEGKKVTLDGTGSSSRSSGSTGTSSNTELNFLWKQIAGKSVKLSHIDTAEAKFKAPHVKKTTKLRFKLTVDDGKGNSSSDTVKIVVKPHNHKHNHNHNHK